MAKQIKITGKMNVESIKLQFELAKCGFSGSGPIGKRSSGSFYIRVLNSSSFNYRTGTQSTSYSYFELNKDKVIISTPRGYAKYFKGKVIEDIEDYIE